MREWYELENELTSLYEEAGQKWYNRLSEDNKTALKLVSFSPAIISSMSFFGVGNSWSDELWDTHERAYNMIREYCSNEEARKLVQPSRILQIMTALQAIKNTEISFNNDMVEFAKIYHLSDEVIQQARNEALMETRETMTKAIKALRRDFFQSFCRGVRLAS